MELVEINVFNLLPGLGISALKNNQVFQQYSVTVLLLSGGIIFFFPCI